MSPYDIEALLIGLVLRYGIVVARIVLPSLTSDKFCFGFSGSFGAEHSIVWNIIFDLYQDHRNPTYTEVSHTLNGAYDAELRALTDRVESMYKVYSLDVQQVMRWADIIDKQGIVFNVSRNGGKLGVNLTDVQSFMKAVNSINDIDQWVSQQLSIFRSQMSSKSTGYRRISTVAEEVGERWERIFRGEEVLVYPCGLPILEKHKLFPRSKLAIIHGLSGSGKSSFVFQVNLGTAIYLYQNNLAGCVAINSLEMDEYSLINTLVAPLARVDTSKLINKSMNRDELNRLQEAKEYLAHLPILIDTTNFLTTTAMQYRAQGLHVSEHGPVVQLSSDYGELFRDEGDSKEQRVNTVFREQFTLAKLINASVLAISQSTIDKQTSGKSYIAGADGIRYSAGALQAADIVVELWNPVAAKNAGRPVVAPEGVSLAHPYLLIEKFRGAKTGEQIGLGWLPHYSCFFDLDLNQGAVFNEEIIFDHLSTVDDTSKDW